MTDFTLSYSDAVQAYSFCLQVDEISKLGYFYYFWQFAHNTEELADIGCCQFAQLSCPVYTSTGKETPQESRWSVYGWSVYLAQEISPSLQGSFDI